MKNIDRIAIKEEMDLVYDKAGIVSDPLNLIKNTMADVQEIAERQGDLNHEFLKSIAADMEITSRNMWALMKLINGPGETKMRQLVAEGNDDKLQIAADLIGNKTRINRTWQDLEWSPIIAIYGHDNKVSLTNIAYNRIMRIEEEELQFMNDE